MQTITQNDLHFNDPDVLRTHYSYALKVQPCDLYEMDRDQLLQVCLEYLSLVSMLLGLIYNAKAEVSTRIAAIDLLVTSVRRTARRTMDQVTATFPVVLEKDIPGSVSKKLGLHRNTVSKAYQSIETHGGIARTYEGEVGGSQHLRVAIQPDFLREGFTIEDKKERIKIVPTTIEEEEVQTPASVPSQCACCGSDELYTVCRPCGHLEPLASPMDAEDLQQPHNHFSFDLRLVTQQVQSIQEEPTITDLPVALHHDTIEPTLNEVATQFHRSPVQLYPRFYPRIIKESMLKIDDCGHDHGPAPSSICWECKKQTWTWNHLKDRWMCNWCYTVLHEVKV